jgi:hypothetical protein
VHRARKSRPSLVGLLLVFGIFATACGAAASAGGSGGLSVSIVSPSDGDSVSQPFTVKLDASEPIGDPSTGDRHVHLCFDGASCDELASSVIAYSSSAVVSGLSPGMHTIEASLRNADHSDTGVSTTITVKITGGDTSGATTGTGGSSSSGGGSGGYGY